MTTPQQQVEELRNPDCQHGTRLVLMCSECVVIALATKDTKADELFAVTEELRSALAAKGAEIERLKEDVEVGLNISGSFFEALKPLQLKTINVSNPGQHVTDLIAEIARLRSRLAEAEGMRDKAEWRQGHKFVWADSGLVSKEYKCCDDERHTWDDSRWIAQAERKG